MKVIVNEEKVTEAIDKLSGLSDYLYGLGDTESAEEIDRIESLLNEGIQDKDL